MCGRVSLLVIALIAAGCSSGSGSNVDAGNTSDAGTTVDAGTTPDGGVTPDGGTTPDGGSIDPTVGYQTGFESPVVAEGVVNGTFPAGWMKPPSEGVQEDGLASVYRPAAAEMDGALPDGQQVFTLADSDQSRAAGAYLPNVVFMRSGETWEVSAKVAYSKTVSDFRYLNIEADGDVEYLAEVDVDTTTLTSAGTFQTVTLSIPAQPVATTLSLYFFARATQGHAVRVFIDDLKIRRVSSPDALPIEPVHPYIVNGSFEQPQQGMGGFDANGSAGWTRTIIGSGFAGQWRPTSLQVTQVEPLAAPAIGNQVLDMGTAGGTTEALAVHMTSRPFAIAEAGANYSVLAAVGKRTDLAACETARISILANGEELVHFDKAGSSLPNGGFTNFGVDSGAISASLAGQQLSVALTVLNPVTSEDCRIMFDNVRGWKP